MISPFGVDHGEISKGVPKGLAAVAGKYEHMRIPANRSMAPGEKRIAYAAERLKAHKAGRTAARLPQERGNVFGGQTPKSSGRSARTASRSTLERVREPAISTTSAASVDRYRAGPKIAGRGPSGYSGRSKPWSA
jgi:hypothetical protein